MTQDKNHGPENRNWMEIAREDEINDVRHSGQRLPFIAAAVALVIIGGGAVFAQTNNESPAQAEEISVTQTSEMPSTVSDPAATTSSIAPAMTSGGTPVIPNVAPGVNGSYGDDDDEEEDDDRDDRHGDDDDHEDHDDEEDDD
jgi:hypothetical protein